MIFFTADEHYDHAKIIEHARRPFANVQAMNEALIERHNDRVGPTDTVYHLGDFAWHRPAHVAEYLRRLNGYHILIAGGHDGCSEIHRKHKREIERYRQAGFSSVHQRDEIVDFAIGRVRLQHEPDHSTLPPTDASWILCGHVHDHWRAKGHNVNVGVDAWNFAPVSRQELAAFLRTYRPSSTPTPVTPLSR